MSASTETSSGWCSAEIVVNRSEICDAVQHEHEHHGAGQLHMQRLSDCGKSIGNTVLHDAPGIKRRARVSEGKAEHDGGKPELLEAENGRDQPGRGGKHAMHDGTARRAIGSYGFRHVAPEQPRGDVRHADADEIGEIGGGDNPHWIAGNQEHDGRSRGQCGRSPWAIGPL
jgi:hypothetical protein